MKSSIKILIVEDNIFTAQNIENSLKEFGYSTIDIAISSTQAIRKIKNNRPELILLDLHLKNGYTGIDVASHKEVLFRIPIIYITNVKDSQILLELQTTKPKAYLSKPIKEEELEFAVSLALNLSEKKGLQELGNGFNYNLETQKLLENRKDIPLTKYENTLLHRLIIAKGELVGLEDLGILLWGGWNIQIGSSLRTLIGSLRKKIGSEMIQNVPSLGYKLTLPKDKT